ncbi:cytochrome c oxidase accessory protein CcoG [Bosea sp. BIWAKO-01]|uniref:cytochrome c oxidase accessory protein CcoG n=1 Tax=Bosea sp. BIWAKO-01 TaxID=506668 RepID=UPI00086FA161|nr:cytochrome c oxidase accessory protein CcoG [Bosea sp. BIWAKO-01]GAU84526.1 Cbb3-type cytochrome oxidase biogenesis protein CcoG [Bosea sp. BIWAKO-01]
MALAESEDAPLFAPSKKVYPQSVSGPFRRAKWLILVLCLGIYYLLPFLRWDRGPNLPNQAVLADIANNRFYFFFIEIWPQEVYYFTGLLILAAFVLFLMNAVAGRVWCGYLCPQTVWTDLFLAVERAFEGDRRERMKRDEGPWTADKLARKTGKHLVWLVIAWWTGGAWVLYFADAPTLVRELATFTAPLSAYVWIGILTFTTYALAGIMREQVCTFMCPWPRIQAALTDDDALNVTYRYDRGDPRVSVKQATRLRAANEPAGDCIDCFQCVAVCPTGIDIRDGSQMDCIQCGLCIDACDTVMLKINRPAGLIAYDTDDNVKRRIAGQKPVYRLIRARTLIYTALIGLVGGAMIYQLATRSTAGISVLHERTPLFVTLSDGSIRNAYTIRLLNKRPDSRPFALTVAGLPGIRVETVGTQATADLRPIITVDPDSSREIRALVTVPAGIPLDKSQTITFTASDLFAGEVVTARDHFIAP